MDDYPRYMNRTITKLDSMDFSPNAIKNDLDRALQKNTMLDKPRGKSMPKGGFSASANRATVGYRSMGTFKDKTHSSIKL